MLQAIQFNQSDHAVNKCDPHYDCNTGTAALCHVSPDL